MLVMNLLPALVDRDSSSRAHTISRLSHTMRILKLEQQSHFGLLLTIFAVLLADSPQLRSCLFQY